jgi:hypothetical protein
MKMQELNRNVLLCFILLLTFSNCNRNSNYNNNTLEDSLITEKDSILKDSSLIAENHNLSNPEMLPLRGEWKMYEYLPPFFSFNISKKDGLDTVCVVSIIDSSFVKKREDKILFQEIIRFNMKFSNCNYTRFDFPNYSEKYIRYNTKDDYFALFEKGEDGVIEYYKRK